MEPEGSLPFSQNPTTGPYPEPDIASQHLLTQRSHLRLCLPISPPFRFSDQNYV